jgi:DNA-binding PadR family transcriptional regulator
MEYPLHYTEPIKSHRCGGHHGPRGWFAFKDRADRHDRSEHFAHFDPQHWADRARHGFGGGGRRGGWERGFGGPGGPGGFGGRERLFDAGDLKLVLLKLLSEQPSYGYQLIKTMEERLAGGYTPSPGVIYPTLTLLEEEGLASVAASDTGKKVYSVTPEGLQLIEANKGRLDQIFARLNEKGERFERGRSPELMKAFMDLRGAVLARITRGTLTPEQTTKISEAIHAAAKAIDQL